MTAARRDVQGVTIRFVRRADTEMVPAVAWTPQGELYACSEDKEISRWSMDGELLGKAGELDAVVTDMHWFPSVGAQAADTFALACTDGACRPR